MKTLSLIAFSLVLIFAAAALAAATTPVAPAQETVEETLAAAAAPQAPKADSALTLDPALLGPAADTSFRSTCSWECKAAYLACLDSGTPQPVCAAERSACLAAC